MWMKKKSAFINRTIANSILNYAECFGSKPSIVSTVQCTWYNNTFDLDDSTLKHFSGSASIKFSEATTIYKVFHLVFHKTRLWNEKKQVRMQRLRTTLIAGFKMKSATLWNVKNIKYAYRSINLFSHWNQFNQFRYSLNWHFQWKWHVHYAIRHLFKFQGNKKNFNDSLYKKIGIEMDIRTLPF